MDNERWQSLSCFPFAFFVLFSSFPYLSGLYPLKEMPLESQKPLVLAGPGWDFEFRASSPFPAKGFTCAKEEFVAPSGEIQ